MLKIQIQITEDKQGSCKVSIVNPKDLSKCSEGEKISASMVLEKIEKSLLELEKGE